MGETDLLRRELIACNHLKTKTNTNAKGETQIPQPDALRHPAEKQSKRRTGQGPTRTTTTRICHRHSAEKPLCRNSQKDDKLVATKCETRFSHAPKTKTKNNTDSLG